MITARAPKGRSRRALRALEIAAGDLLQRFGAANPDMLIQPGAVAFPKQIFETDAQSPPVPDGRSLEYLELAETFWEAAWASADQKGLDDFPGAAVRMVQQTVVEAHVIERRLMARLEAAS